MKRQNRPLLARGRYCGILVTTLTMLHMGMAVTAAFAGVRGQAGAYRVELTTRPEVIPVGKVRMTLRITDASGKPVEGAQVRALVKMPTMNMGEKETTAQPQVGEPGVYTTDAVFMMEGPYNAAIAISGPQGQTTINIPLQTGQNTNVAAGGGFPIMSLLLWLLAAALILFIAYRMRKTGQRVNWRGMVNRGTVSGLVLLAVMFAVSLYAIRNWRRPGAMTPIEAQAMQMDTPAPPGVAPVTLAKVERGTVESTVRYTGQAVGYLEQDIVPRVQGWIVWMPFYAGDRVKAGQVLARLDTSQINPQVAERQAGVNMARREAGVSQSEYQQALAEVTRMRAEVVSKRDAVLGAQAETAAARAEKANAEAELEAMQTMIADADAELVAAQATQDYWEQEIARQKALLERGAVSRAEYQRDTAEAAAVEARLHHALSRQKQVQAQVRAAQAALRKADAMLQAAERRAQQMASELRAAEAAVRSAEAMAEAARRKIDAAQAGIAQAQASLSAATTTRSYTEIRALTDGIVTQRIISPGTLVNPGQTILKVAQISPIRLQANVAEVDLAHIRVGARVTVQGQDRADKPLEARVTSVTPAVDPIARTGVVEAVVPNQDGRFRPGQYVILNISTRRSRETLRVPTRAVVTRIVPSTGVISTQTQSYVWVAEPVAGQENQYTVMPVDVQTGVSDGRYTEILSGLKEGQRVVDSGYLYLKSGDTVEDIGEAAADSAGMSTPPHADHSQHRAGASPSEATVTVSSAGFTPASITLKAGVPTRLTFIRKDEQNCGTEVVLPEYGIKKALPLNQPVVVEFTPKQGEITFTCGMNMLRGKVVGR